MENRIKILIADPYQIFREGLRRVFATDKTLNVIDEACNLEETSYKTRHLVPDIVVMEINMPGKGGITTILEIKDNCPEVKILILAFSPENLKKAIDSGASGYILKDSSSRKLIEAIHDVMDGYCPISPSLIKDFIIKTNTQQPNKGLILNRRQTDLLEGISAGNEIKDISRSLFISTSTAKREIRNIFNKLGVNDRSAAVSEAMRRGLIK